MPAERLRRGFQAWRADLDARLLARATELGVKVLQPVRVGRPVVSAGRVVGMETDRGRLTGRFVLDAAGGGHWLARCLGLPIDRHTPPLVAWYGYAAGSCPARDAAPALAADEGGWTWTARVGRGLYQWTRLAFRGRGPGAGWLPPEFAGLAARGGRRAADVTWRIVRPAAGPGYFLAGDAAAVLDPSSSHGVLGALMGGVLAGHLLAAVRDGWPEADAARRYRAWLGAGFDHDARRLRELYAELPDPPAWSRADAQQPHEMVFGSAPAGSTTTAV